MTPVQAIQELFLPQREPTHERVVGIEIEHLGLWSDGSQLRYMPSKEGRPNPKVGVRDLLERLSEKEGWPVTLSEIKQPIGLTTPYGRVSLEPGSQLELSSTPQPDLHRLATQIDTFELALEAVAAPFGIRWVGLGMTPCSSVEEIDVIPSARYHIMTEYLQKRGYLATAMMRLTSSVHVNLDYLTEEEGIEMLQVALLLAPLSYALFSNSPLARGNLTPYLSYRQHIWNHTDPDRSGLLHEAFAEGFDFSSYANLIWQKPLMFIKTKTGKFISAEGRSLNDFSNQPHPEVELDEENQLGAIHQLFTEARLKQGYIEIRSIDGQRPRERYAAAAFWMGILYNQNARRFVLETLKDLSPPQKEALLQSSIRDGLDGEIEQLQLKPFARELYEEARRELKRRNKGEEKFLEPAEEILREGLCPAQQIIRSFRNEWRGNFSQLLSFASHRN